MVDVGSLVQSDAVASFDILIPADGKTSSALESARTRATTDGLLLVDSLPAETRDPVITIELKDLADEEWPRHLQGFVRPKIPSSEFPRVLKSSGFIRLEAHAPASRAWELLRTVTMQARDLAAANHGWIYEPYRAELHDARSIASSIPQPQVRDARVFTRMMAVTNTKGGLDHVRSIGLWRLGLPELYLPDVARADLERARELLRATTQALLQNGGVTRRGVIEVDLAKLPADWPRSASGTGRLTWQARWMRGPIKNNAMQIVLSVPGARENDPGALSAAIREYAGDDTKR